MLLDFDKIIAMAESENIPRYLKSSSKYEYWKIEDAKSKSLDTTRKIRDEIRKRVNALVSQI